jgi:PAS domain S-box-containing protein
VPPDEFLGTNQAAREVERLLATIREREEIEYTLRRQRNELQESERRFRQIAENIRESVLGARCRRRRITFVSPMYEEVFGRSCASLYANPRSFLDAIHVDDRARVEAVDRRVSEPARPSDERSAVIRPDGAVRWIGRRGFPCRAGGSVSAWSASEETSPSPASARRHPAGEAALRSSEERWRSVSRAPHRHRARDPAEDCRGESRVSGSWGTPPGAQDTQPTWTSPIRKTSLACAEASRAAAVGRQREVQLEKRYRHKDGTIHLGRATGR